MVRTGPENQHCLAWQLLQKRPFHFSLAMQGLCQTGVGKDAIPGGGETITSGVEEAASTREEDSPEFRGSLSPAPSGSSHTSPLQNHRIAFLSVNTLTLKVDILSGSEFNSCYNSASHRISVCFWFSTIPILMR